VSSQLVQHNKKKDSVRCGRWDASFRLLATSPPTVHVHAKHVKVLILIDFVDFPRLPAKILKIHIYFSRDKSKFYISLYMYYRLMSSELLNIPLFKFFISSKIYTVLPVIKKLSKFHKFPRL
jgi:hypothetical protein